MTESQTLKVVGMSCGHCKATVTKALTALPGVTDVSVDLKTGEVKLAAAGQIDPTVVKAAIEAAGYEVVV